MRADVTFGLLFRQIFIQHHLQVFLHRRTHSIFLLRVMFRHQVSFVTAIVHVMSLRFLLRLAILRKCIGMLLAFVKRHFWGTINLGHWRLILTMNVLFLLPLTFKHKMMLQYMD